MNRDDVNWYGYWSALITPFDADGCLNQEALAVVVDTTVKQGCHGLLVNGSTGEWTVQSLDERRSVAQTVIEATAGRVPVVVNVTSCSLEPATALAAHAAASGADAIMAAVPPGARLDLRESTQYFSTVFGACPLPAWIYNFPQDSATNLTPAQLLQLGEIESVVAVKQSTGDLAELIETISLCAGTLRVFGHLLSRLGAALIAGGFGGDGHFGSGMLLGAAQPAFFDLLADGRTDEALEIADRFTELNYALRGSADDYNWRYGGMQASLKAAMGMLGQPAGFPRLPKLAIHDGEALAAIREALVNQGLLA